MPSGNFLPSRIPLGQQSKDISLVSPSLFLVLPAFGFSISCSPDGAAQCFVLLGRDEVGNVKFRGGFSSTPHAQIRGFGVRTSRGICQSQEFHLHLKRALGALLELPTGLPAPRHRVHLKMNLWKRGWVLSVPAAWEAAGGSCIHGDPVPPPCPRGVPLPRAHWGCPCTPTLLHNSLEDTSGPGQCHFPFKMHPARGAAASLEQKEHLCQLLFLASFCLLLLKLSAGISAGSRALFIDSALIQSKSLHHCAGVPRPQSPGAGGK